MKGEKIHFFNFKWREYPVWVHFLVGSIPVLMVYIPIWFFDIKELSYPGIILYLLFFGYFLWQSTLRNAFYFIRKHQYKLIIDRKKLEFDATFISKVWLDEDGLNIQRINRVDTFPVDHLREDDVERLLTILKEYKNQVVE